MRKKQDKKEQTKQGRKANKRGGLDESEQMATKAQQLITLALENDR